MCHCAERRIVLRILTHAGQRLLICVTILASCPYDQRNVYFTMLDASGLTAFPMGSSAFNSDDQVFLEEFLHQFLIYETLWKHGMFSISIGDRRISSINKYLAISFVLPACAGVCLFN